MWDIGDTHKKFEPRLHDCAERKRSPATLPKVGTRQPIGPAIEISMGKRVGFSRRDDKDGSSYSSRH